MWYRNVGHVNFDRRTAFLFAVNPVEVKTDAYHFNDVEDDSNWDAVWDVATAVDELGWTAEFRTRGA